MAVSNLQIRIDAVYAAAAQLKAAVRDTERLGAAAAKTNSVLVAGDKTSRSAYAGQFKLGRAFLYSSGQAGFLNSELSLLSGAMGGVSIAAVAGAAAIGGIALALGKSVQSAINFEAEITRVGKTAGLSAAETREFGQEILALSRRIPVSTTALTEIAVVAGQLGIQGGKNIAIFTEEVAKLSSTTGVAAAELATSLGQVAQITNLPTKDIGRFSSALTQLGNDFNSTEGQILDFTTRIAGVGTVLGLNSVQLAAIGNAFASVGVEAERGGTAVQRVFIAMQEAISKGGDELKVFSAVTGQTAEGFRALVKSNPQEAFTLFVEGIKAAGDQAVPVLEALELADARLISAFLAVAQSGSLMRESFDTATEAALRNTATNDEFARSTNTTAAQIQLLKNNVGALAVNIGQELQPAVDGIVAGLIKVTEAAAASGPYISAMVSGLTTLIGMSVEGWAAIFDRIADALKTIKERLDEVNATMPLLTAAAAGLALAFAFIFPGAALIGGITAVIVGMGLLTADVDGASAAALRLKVTMVNAITKILDALRSFTESMEGADKFLPGDPFKNWSRSIREARNDLYLLGEEAQDALNIRGVQSPSADAIVGSARQNPAFQLPEGDPARVKAELQLMQQLAEAGVALDAVGTSASGLKINAEQLAAVLGGLAGGGGGGGGSVPKAISGIQSLAQAFEQWHAVTGGSIEGFVATIELAREQSEANKGLTEEAFRARVELTKLAIVLGKEGISSEAFIAQQNLIGLRDAFLQSGMAADEFILHIKGITQAMLEQGKALAKKMGKGVTTYSYGQGSEDIVVDGTRYSGGGNLTEEGVKKVMDSDLPDEVKKKIKDAYDEGTKHSGSKGYPKLHDGIDYVPRDMTANLQRGERVVPAKENKSSWGGATGNNFYGPVTVNATGSVDEAIRDLALHVR